MSFEASKVPLGALGAYLGESLMASWGHFGGFLEGRELPPERFWRHFATSGDVLEAPGQPWGRLGRAGCCRGGVLGGPRALPEASKRHLGGSLGGLGAIMGGLGPILGGFSAMLGSLGRSWGLCRPSWERSLAIVGSK